MTAKKPSPPKAPRKPPGAKKIAELKAKLLADPNTAKIAANVGLGLDAYVAQVMQFIENPSLEPELYIVSDEDLKSQGIVPPDEKAIINYLGETAEVLEEVSEVSKFSVKKQKKVELNSGPKQLDEEFSDPGLKKALESQLRGKRGGKT